MAALQDKVYSSKKYGSAYGSKLGHYNASPGKVLGSYNTPVKMLGHYNGLSSGGKSNLHMELRPRF